MKQRGKCRFNKRLVIALALLTALMIVHSVYQPTHCPITETYQLPIPPQSTDRHLTLKEITYQNLPKMTLVVRTCSAEKFLTEFYCMYLRSVRLFWPASYGSMSLVLDAESEQDHIFGDTFKRQMTKHLPQIPVRVVYEPLPRDTSILKASIKSFGYNQQLWSTFFADEYSDEPVIAFMDTDLQLVTPLTKEYLFNNGKLRVFGDGTRHGWVKEWEDTTQCALGLPQIVNFMVTFPQLIHRSTYTNCRNHILKRFKTDDFEVAFSQFYPPGTIISPINIFMSYAWYFEHDRYDWHIKTANLQENNDRLPDGYKIGSKDTIPSILGVAHMSDFKEWRSERMTPGYCMSLKAAGRDLPGCTHVAHNWTLMCDFQEDILRFPWPTGDTWCKAGTLEECCKEALEEHYRHVAVLAKEKNLKFDKGDVYLIDKLAKEMNVSCPRVDLP